MLSKIAAYVIIFVFTVCGISYAQEGQIGPLLICIAMVVGFIKILVDIAKLDALKKIDAERRSI